jgi:hypothetical protein
MSEYTVEFRIEGLTLVPSDVTSVLELQPCRVDNGLRNKIGNYNPVPLWSYDGVSTESCFVEQNWASLEDGLQFLLEILLPKKDLIRLKFGDFNMFWWCGHFQEGFDSNITLSPVLLGKLSDFGVDLILCNYCSSPDDHQKSKK